MPRADTSIWLHGGFTAEQVIVKDFGPGPGFGVKLSVSGAEMCFVFGAHRDDGLPLSVQEAAAREAARVFTEIADRLAQMLPLQACPVCGGAVETSPTGFRTCAGYFSEHYAYRPDPEVS